MATLNRYRNLLPPVVAEYVQNMADEIVSLEEERDAALARAERAEATLARLRPKDITDKLASVECDNGLDDATILAAVAAAEAEVEP
jgi:hypothetical protein